MSYKKLWELFIDRGMQKRDLQNQYDTSATSIAKDVNDITNLLNEDMLRVKL